MSNIRGPPSGSTGILARPKKRALGSPALEDELSSATGYDLSPIKRLRVVSLGAHKRLSGSLARTNSEHINPARFGTRSTADPVLEPTPRTVPPQTPTRPSARPWEGSRQDENRNGPEHSPPLGSPKVGMKEAEFVRRQKESRERYVSKLESIYAKYSHDFTDTGDEIDLATGEIVIDNGHLAQMKSGWNPGVGDHTVQQTAAGGGQPDELELGARQILSQLIEPVPARQISQSLQALDIPEDGPDEELSDGWTTDNSDTHESNQQLLNDYLSVRLKDTRFAASDAKPPIGGTEAEHLVSNAQLSGQVASILGILQKSGLSEEESQRLFWSTLKSYSPSIEPPTTQKKNPKPHSRNSESLVGKPAPNRAVSTSRQRLWRADFRSRRSISPSSPPNAQHKSTFSPSDDRLIQVLREDAGLDWDEISARFPGKGAKDLRQRYLEVRDQLSRESSPDSAPEWSHGAIGASDQPRQEGNERRTGRNLEIRVPAPTTTMRKAFQWEGLQEGAEEWRDQLTFQSGTRSSQDSKPEPVKEKQPDLGGSAFPENGLIADRVGRSSVRYTTPVQSTVQNRQQERPCSVPARSKSVSFASPLTSDLKRPLRRGSSRGGIVAEKDELSSDWITIDLRSDSEGSATSEQDEYCLSSPTLLPADRTFLPPPPRDSFSLSLPDSEPAEPEQAELPQSSPSRSHTFTIEDESGPETEGILPTLTRPRAVEPRSPERSSDSAPLDSPTPPRRPCFIPTSSPPPALVDYNRQLLQFRVGSGREADEDDHSDEFPPFELEDQVEEERDGDSEEGDSFVFTSPRRRPLDSRLSFNFDIAALAVPSEQSSPVRSRLEHRRPVMH